LWSVIAQLVVGDEVGGLGEDQRGDDLVQGLLDRGLDLLDVPAGAHARHVRAHPVHLVVVGARHQEDELGVAGLQDTASIQ